MSEKKQPLTASGRVLWFLDVRRDTMGRGLDPEHIISLHTNTELEAHLLVSDLRQVLKVRADLLAELRHLVRLLEPLEQGGSLQVPGLATLNGARAAIAKATGGGQ